ncbi:RGCVC family protein [Blastococcus brunescens]|uniref:RGCVC family protein n=1 Tax=Blastococcus brunescens TaxID=1564165 RepID=UPI003BEF17BB
MSSAPSVALAPAPVATASSCAVCPHPMADHDRISLRFCQATQPSGSGSGTTRGCVCPT